MAATLSILNHLLAKIQDEQGCIGAVAGPVLQRGDWPTVCQVLWGADPRVSPEAIGNRAP